MKTLDILSSGAMVRLAKIKRRNLVFTRDNARAWFLARLNDDCRFHYSANGDYCNVADSVLGTWRDVGDSHDIVRLGHTGWYADQHQENLYRGHVWQLPARNGEPLFIAGYHESEQTEYVILDCSRGRLRTFDSKEDAARAGDELARIMAEKEREYQEEWEEARQLSDTCEQLNAHPRAGDI